MTDSTVNASTDAVAARGTRASRADSQPWLKRRGWQYGSNEFNVASLFAFAVLTLFPLAAFVAGGFRAPAWPSDYPLFGLLWLLFVALAFPAWSWGESRAFDRWVATLDPAARDAERARQRERAAGARLFWFGLMAAWFVAGVLAIAAR
jgi:hypothetical protein